MIWGTKICFTCLAWTVDAGASPSTSASNGWLIGVACASKGDATIDTDGAAKAQAQTSDKIKTVFIFNIFQHAVKSSR